MYKVYLFSAGSTFGGTFLAINLGRRGVGVGWEAISTLRGVAGLRARQRCVLG